MAVQQCAIPEEICKQTWESYLIGVDNSQVMHEGEYILLNQSEVVAVDRNGDDATSDILDNSEMQVRTADPEEISVTPVTDAMLVTRIKDGTEELSKYIITFRAKTSLGNQYETDVRLKIKNYPWIL